MRKLIYVFFSIIMISCGSRSYVSDDPAIVISVVLNDNCDNHWKYLVDGVYIDSEIDLMDVDTNIDPRNKTNKFYLYTNKRYSVGDTIKLAQ